MSATIFHIPFISLTEGLVFHSIVQRSPKPGSSAPEDHPTVKHYTSVEPLLADTEVDVVIVTTPPDTHYDLTAAALQSGKHVLVEKPFVPTAAEADKLAEMAKARGLVLCVYQNRRWDADFLMVRQLLSSGQLGRAVEFETHFDRLRAGRPTNWKGTLSMDHGGGVLYDLGTHLIDQAYVLFGKPATAYARFVNQRDGRIVSGEGGLDNEPDSLTAVLSYPKTGTLVYVRAGVMSVETKQMRFWVRGTKGSYHKEGLDPQEDQLKAGVKPSAADFGHEDASKAGRLCVAKEDGSVVEEPLPDLAPETYLQFYKLFAKSLDTKGEADVPVPATQAADVLWIIEAVRASAKSGKEVVVK